VVYVVFVIDVFSRMKTDPVRRLSAQRVPFGTSRNRPTPPHVELIQPARAFLFFSSVNLILATILQELYLGRGGGLAAGVERDFFSYDEEETGTL